MTITAPSWAWIALAIGVGILAYHALSPVETCRTLRAWYRAWRRSRRMPRRLGHRFPLSHLLRIFRRSAPKPVLFDQDAWIGESIVVDFRTWQERHHHHDTPGGAAERSRATMWDVVRFLEVLHRYDLVVVENVVDAARWIYWDSWRSAFGAAATTPTTRTKDDYR